MHDRGVPGRGNLQMDHVLPTLHISLGPQDILGVAWAQSTMITQEGHHGSSWNTVNRSADLAGNPKLQEGKAPSVAHNATP